MLLVDLVGEGAFLVDEGEYLQRLFVVCSGRGGADVLQRRVVIESEQGSVV